MSIRTREKTKNGTLHLYKRVPVRYASVEPRKFVWVSLHTDSASAAEMKAKGVWQQMLDGWEAKLAGDTTDAEARFEAARQLAAARGFRYLGAPAVAKLPRGELLERVAAFREGDAKEAAAVLGGAEEPDITISRALELYWTLAREKTLGKSEDQLRRWQNPRKKSIKNLIAVIGDKPISRIVGDDMLDFRNWWLDRLETEDLTPNSANKDLIHIGDVLKTVNKMKRLGLVLPLSDLSFKEGDKKTRPPFSDVWIRDRILAAGALDGLNEEARGIVQALVNTGCRPSERGLALCQTASSCQSSSGAASKMIGRYSGLSISPSATRRA